MTIKSRLDRLEKTIGPEVAPAFVLSTDAILRKIGFDPEGVRAAAREQHTSRADVVAIALGFPNGQAFKTALRGD